MNRSFASLLLSLLLVLGVLLAVVMSSRTEPGRDRPPFDRPALPIVYRFTNDGDPGSTFLAVAFRLTEPSRFEVRFNSSAEWDRASVAWTLEELITLTHGPLAVEAYETSEAHDSCDKATRYASLAECPATALRSSGPSRFGSTLKPGLYVAQAAGFGASRASLSFEVALDHNATVLWSQTGHTRLAMLDPAGRSGDREVQTATHALPVPAYVRFRTAGSNGPAYAFAASDGAATLTFTATHSSTDRPRWHSLDHNTTSYGVAFGMAPGNLTFAADLRFTMPTPNAALVGLVLAPAYLGPTGDFRPLGPRMADADQ